MADEHGIKIVLVEDDPDLQMFAKTLLSKCHDAQVFATDNGVDAVKLVKEVKPALIVQDLWLKGSMNGWECIRQYRSFNTDVKIIITSFDMRTDGPNDIQLLVNHSITATIRKPYNPQTFRDKVNKVLSESNSYSEYTAYALDEGFVKVSPEAESIIHTIRGLLSVVRNRCENYWLDYSADPRLIGNSPEEITKKALISLKECSTEIDCIAAELDKIKFLE